MNGLLSLGVAVDEQIEGVAGFADQRNELLPAAIGIAGVVNNS